MSTVTVGLVRLHRHFKGLPEGFQGNLTLKENVHLLSSEPNHYCVYTNHILTDIEFDVKGCLVSTISTPVSLVQLTRLHRSHEPLHFRDHYMTDL